MDLLAPDLDRSHAGGIDAPILSLCELINARPEFYTTSSCSGRVVLFWQRELAAAGAVGPDAELEPEPEPELADGDAEPPLDERTKAAGGSWLYITHDEPRLEDMLAEAAELPATGLAVFKQEPFLLHVRCCSMEAATVLYRLARECGLRESGVAPVGEFPLCALRSTALKMDAIVGSDGNWIVSQDYLALTVDVATQKMRANLAKLGKLERCLRSSLAMHLTPTTASDAAEAAAAGCGAGVIGVVPSKVKAVKTALETRSWIDKNRCIFDCSSADADAVAAAAGSKAGEEAGSAAEVDSAAAGVTTPAFTKEFTMYYIDGVPRDMLVMNLLSLCGVLDGRTDLRLIGFDDIASEEMLQINPSGMLPLLVVSRPGAQALPPLMLSGVELCGQYLDGAFPGVFLPEAGGADVMLRFAAISTCVQIETCGMYAFMDTYKEIEDEATALQKGKRIVYTATGFFRGDLLMPWSALRENKMHHTLLMLECFTVLDAKVAQMRKADAGGAMPYTCGSAGPLLPDWKLYWHLKLTVRMGRNFITKFPALLAWFADFERVHADVAKLWPKTWTGEAPANKTIVDMHKVNEGIDRAFEMQQKQGSSSGGSVRLSAPVQ